MATGMMIDGEWRKEGYQQDEDGRFQRNPTTFRNWVKADGKSDFPVESDRYHLYVSLACPWAHRTLIMRKIRGLEEVISLSIVDPYMGDEGWQFSETRGAIPDKINGANYLREIYAKADPQYTGRVTVPILWDKKQNTIVNNESREIVRMFDVEFAALAQNPVSFYYEDLHEEIEQAIDAIYEPINNGVYKAGFAQSREAYVEAVIQLFENFDYWEQVLGKQQYMCGDRLTEADWFMFTTMFRFDAVYYLHFKCNLRHLWDYPNLWNYLKRLYRYPGVKETCDLDHIKRHYYQSHPQLNPSGIVPIGPIIDFE